MQNTEIIITAPIAVQQQTMFDWSGKMSDKFCLHESGMGGCLQEKFEGELSLSCGTGCAWFQPPDYREQEDENCSICDCNTQQSHTQSCPNNLSYCG